LTENEIGDAIIAAAMKVHSVAGPGLLESAYETCLAYELEKRYLPVRRQASIPIRYEGLTIDNGYRVDTVVGDRVVVELKAVETILPVHKAQLLSYLRLEASSSVISSTFTSRICATALCGWSMDSDPRRPLRHPLRPPR
jgi:GxxExxY protein